MFYNVVANRRQPQADRGGVNHRIVVRMTVDPRIPTCRGKAYRAVTDQTGNRYTKREAL